MKTKAFVLALEFWVNSDVAASILENMEACCELEIGMGKKRPR